MISNPTYPGILIESRPIGLLRMNDGGKIDDKILCVAKDDPRYANYKTVTDIEQHILKEIAHFFQVYKDLEGKKVEVVGWGTAEEAKAIIMKAVNLYGQSVKEQRVKKMTH